MDAKLKALKVADLKAVLTAAAVHTPAKATKPDLIARILASKPALAAYAALHPPDDLLAPPEEVDWNDDQLEPSPTPVVAPASPPPVVVVVADPPPTTTTTTDTPATVDPEVEKRRLRAARFGIPFVEPKPAPAPAQPRKTAAKPTRAPSPAKTGVDPKKLQERAARFGLKTAPAPTPDTATEPVAVAKSRKRAAPPAPELDVEEVERRRKRAERFGLSTKA